jgi:hypothetical protein
MCNFGEINFSNVYGCYDKCIIGFDMNALYSTAMRFPVPIGDFQWLTAEEAFIALSTDNLHNKFFAYLLFPKKTIRS